jgi:hypothetical protein
MFIGGLFSSLDGFSAKPASHAVAIISGVFGGFGRGSNLSCGWAALSISIPRDGVGRYVGLFLGLGIMLQAITYFIGGLSMDVLLPVLFIVSGILALNLPSPSSGTGAYIDFGRESKQ